MQIPYFRPPPIAFSEIEHRIGGIVDSRAYTKGMYQDMLEDELQAYLGVDHVITCASGTAALWIAMRVMRQMYRCKYIAMPAFNWQSDRIAAESAGYEIVYEDIDPDTWLFGHWMPAADAYIALDTFGSIDCRDYREPFKAQFIVDATHSLGAKGVGSRGLMECFSMAATKPVTAAGEGGFITTNNRDIAEKCAELRDLCARITEIQCVFALEYLSHLDEMLSEKRRIDEYYRKHLPYQFQEIPHDSTHSKICFLCDNSEELIKRAAVADVECRKYYKPLWDMTVSRSVYDRIVCLPAWVGVDVEGVVRALQ
jgi:dTDP-4-amino-4,6-dideoxygalactose transaminase